MIQWVSRVLIVIGAILVLLSAIFAGYMLKWQRDNEFERVNAVWNLVNSKDFKNKPLEGKIVALALQEAEVNRIRDSLQIWQGFFFLGLSIGALLLSLGLAVFFFWETRRLSELQLELSRETRRVSELQLELSRMYTPN